MFYLFDSTTLLVKIVLLNIFLIVSLRFCTSMPVETEIFLKFFKLTENAFSPTKGSLLAVGYDLKSAYDYIVSGYSKQLVNTGLQIELPHGTYGRITLPSGSIWNYPIEVAAGVIHEDYRGNVGVQLFNHSGDDFEIKRGDRVAQIICERICYPTLKELNKVDNNKPKDGDGGRELKKLDNTERGDGGFGST